MAAMTIAYKEAGKRLLSKQVNEVDMWSEKQWILTEGRLADRWSKGHSN